MIPKTATRPLVTAGTVIGIGMGGFVDGILFHQILQIHNMLSNRVIRDTLMNEQINMFWDGLFHAFTWMCVAAGLWLLWHAMKQPGVILSGKSFCGSLLLGWGLFNVVEGIIDHQILQLHHVYQNGNHPLWDMAFLAVGIVEIAVGTISVRSGFLASTRYQEQRQQNPGRRN
jgi:uncharacterized membrane protein